jgi:hypothetical protein
MARRKGMMQTAAFPFEPPPAPETDGATALASVAPTGPRHDTDPRHAHCPE